MVDLRNFAIALKNRYVMIRRTDTESVLAEVVETAAAVTSVSPADLILTTHHRNRAAVVSPTLDVIDEGEIVAVLTEQGPGTDSPYR